MGLKQPNQFLHSQKIEILSSVIYDGWSPCENKFLEFSDEKLAKWRHHICSHFGANQGSELIDQGIRRHCFPVRKHYIDVGESKHEPTAKECPICLSDVVDGKSVETDCGHSYCNLCVMHMMRTNEENLRCPLCRKTVEKLLAREKAVRDILSTRYCQKPAQITASIEAEQRRIEALNQGNTLTKIIKRLFLIILFFEFINIVNFAINILAKKQLKESPLV